MLARTLNEDLANNYGHAGEIFIRYILQNKAKVERDVNHHHRTNYFGRRAGLTKPLWSSQAGAVITGISIAKALELIDWDVDALYTWVVAKLKRMKHDMKDMQIDIKDLIGQFYQDHPRGFLRIRSTDDARIDAATEHFQTPDNNPHYQWVG